MSVIAKIVESVEFKLKAAKVRYWIEGENGVIYTCGNVPVSEPKEEPKRRNLKHPYGTGAKIIDGRLDNLQVGDVAAFIPLEYQPYEGGHFKSIVVSKMSNTYGAGNYEVELCRNGNVEAMRLR